MTPAPRQLRRATCSEEQEHERPDQVELLLDRQGPGVLERRGRGELCEVRLVRENGVPVVHVEQGRDGVAPQAREVDQAVGAGAAEEPVEDEVERECRDDEEERGQEALGPPAPERRQADAARAHPLLEQETRDEEARQDEEEVDPQIAPRRPAELEVVGDDADDGQRPQAVEGG